MHQQHQPQPQQLCRRRHRQTRGCVHPIEQTTNSGSNEFSTNPERNSSMNHDCNPTKQQQHRHRRRDPSSSTSYTPPSYIDTSIALNVSKSIFVDNEDKEEREDLYLSMTWLMGAIVGVSVLVLLAMVFLWHLLLYPNKNNHKNNNPHINTPLIFPELKSSPIYTIPNSMAHIGDKSDAYALLRKELDRQYPPDTPSRSLKAMQSLRLPIYDRISLRPPPPFVLPYDIYNCPKHPPPDYPMEYPTLQLLQHWPPSQSLPKLRHNLWDTSHNNRNEKAHAKQHQHPQRNHSHHHYYAHLAICVFDYGKDYISILHYQKAEVPFVVQNDPSVAETVERWNSSQYRQQLFGGQRLPSDFDTTTNNSNNNKNKYPILSSTAPPLSQNVYHRVEGSNSLEFLFWRPQSSIKNKTMPKEWLHQYSNWTPPTTILPMTYDDWYKHAMEIEEQLLHKGRQQTNHHPYYYHYNETSGPYYYLRLMGCGETGPTGDCDNHRHNNNNNMMMSISSSEYLFDELPFFQPHHKRQTQQLLQLQSLYVQDPTQQRGIHCRLGVPGIMAYNHFDASRNTIVVLGGQRRYILTHPKHCPHLALYPRNHPSARHSQINWTALAEWETNAEEIINHSQSQPQHKKYHPMENYHWKRRYPEFFQHVHSNEVILQAGDVLYLPTHWFHSIISLSTNYQCNTRSGRTDHYDHFLYSCGVLSS